MGKKWFLYALFMGLAAFATAQQDALFSQYLFNKLTINPAYTGAKDAVSITALYRDQWRGIEGAPQSGILSVHTPLKNRKLAIGLQVANDRIGPINETGLWGSFAYRFPLKRGTFSIGLNAGLSNYRTDFQDVFIVDPDDPKFNTDLNLYLPNFGLGIYYYSDNFYAGLSVPHLIDNDLFDNDNGLTDVALAKQYKHYFLMSGYLIDISTAFKLRPSILFRYVENTPLQADMNLSALFVEKLWIGAGYRTSSSTYFHIQYLITPTIRLGYAYDYVLNDLGSETRGSHEILLGLDFGLKQPAVETPRNFSMGNF